MYLFIFRTCVCRRTRRILIMFLRRLKLLSPTWNPDKPTCVGGWRDLVPHPIPVCTESFSGREYLLFSNDKRCPAALRAIPRVAIITMPSWTVVQTRRKKPVLMKNRRFVFNYFKYSKLTFSLVSVLRYYTHIILWYVIYLNYFVGKWNNALADRQWHYYYNIILWKACTLFELFGSSK